MYIQLPNNHSYRCPCISNYQTITTTDVPLSYQDLSIMKRTVNNSTNINKTNNHLSPQLTEHKKTMTYGIGNLGPGLWQTQNLATCNRFIYNFQEYPRDESDDNPLQALGLEMVHHLQTLQFIDQLNEFHNKGILSWCDCQKKQCVWKYYF
jgi:hypothetical protein